jgi:uncharacterized protein (DUF302 family)
VAGNGLVTLPSIHDFATTLRRLAQALEAKGLTIFASVDHAAGAANVGMTLRPTTMVIFGNAAGGTPLMQAAQTAGIDLPLKALVWQGEDGGVRLSYNDPGWIMERHGAGGGAAPAVTGLSGALAAFARHATSGD